MATDETTREVLVLDIEGNAEEAWAAIAAEAVKAAKATDTADEANAKATEGASAIADATRLAARGHLAAAEAARRLTPEMHEQAEEANRLRSAIDDVSDQLKLYGERGAQAAALVEQISDPVKRLAVAERLLARQQRDLNGTFTKLEDNLLAVRAQWELVPGPAKAAGAAIVGAVVVAGAAVAKFTADAMAAYIESNAQAKTAAEELKKELKSLQQEIGKVAYEAAGGTEAVRGFTEVMRELRDESKYTAEDLEQFEENNARANDTMIATSSIIGPVILGYKKLAEAVRDYLKAKGEEAQTSEEEADKANEMASAHRAKILEDRQKRLDFEVRARMQQSDLIRQEMEAEKLLAEEKRILAEEEEKRRKAAGKGAAALAREEEAQKIRELDRQLVLDRLRTEQEITAYTERQAWERNEAHRKAYVKAQADWREHLQSQMDLETEMRMANETYNREKARAADQEEKARAAALEAAYARTGKAAGDAFGQATAGLSAFLTEMAFGKQTIDDFSDYLLDQTAAAVGTAANLLTGLLTAWAAAGSLNPWAALALSIAAGAAAAAIGAALTSQKRGVGGGGGAPVARAERVRDNLDRGPRRDEQAAQNVTLLAQFGLRQLEPEFVQVITGLQRRNALTRV